MIMNLFAIVLVLLTAYLWMARGFWSALIHLVCTLIAGAVAFGVWEPLSYFLLALAPERGFLTFLEGIAWGAGLIVPFALTLFVTRLISDGVIPANVQNNKALDYVGAIACGLGSGVVTAGVLVIAIGYTRVGSNFLGYRPVNYTEQRQLGSGSLERTGGLWVPVDRLTASLYQTASRTSLSTGTPLATWHPNVDVAGYATKISHGDGKSRNAIKAEDFQVLGAWRVGGDDSRVSDLLTFKSGEPAQPYVDLNGETVSTGRLIGYTIRFAAGARESSGQVIFGNGQVRLLMTSPSGESIEAFPVALVSQADAAEADLFARWRFDGNETFIASVGGATTVEMGFEFVVPSGFEPKALYVKNTRVMVDQIEPRGFGGPGGRDGAIASGSLLGGGLDLASLDTENAVNLTREQTEGTIGRGAAVIAQTNALGFNFQKTQKRGLALDDDNRIIDGTAKYDPSELPQRGVVERTLKVDRFEPGEDTSIVQIDVGTGSPASLLGRVGRVVDSDAPPQLVDSDGTAYQALGYIYQDNTIIDIRFTPATPLSGIADLPTLSSARTDQSLTLLFRVSSGVNLRYYALGDAVVFELDPPMEIRGDQR